jgi:hypothetical protein
MNKYIGLHHPSCTLSALLNLLDKLGKIRSPTLSAVPMARLLSCGDSGMCGSHTMQWIFKLQHNAIDVSVAVLFGDPSMLNQGLLRQGLGQQP